MKLSEYLKTGAAIAGLALAATGALAEDFNIPSGDLKAALESYTKQTGVSLVVSGEAIKGVHTRGARGELTSDDALTHILAGTGLIINRHTASAITIVPDARSGDVQPLELAQATPARTAVETVTVTSSKLGGADVQSIPIAITALSQEQLTSSQTAGGPDLIRQVPNLNFSKTNFTGYNIQIRGIGTQAISVTTDPAVAVAFNDTPFIRNHFFEQEFYDVGQVQVARGPQGTLYGRNATAGVVNVVSARPTDQFEAMASADIGNYSSRRLEAMLNIPITDDRLDLRVAGEWTKRNGYTLNETTGDRVDGRDLWSGRVTLGMKPSERLQAYLVWEHFQEDDDRERSTKQLCDNDPGPSQVGPFNQSFTVTGNGGGPTLTIHAGDMLTDLSAAARTAVTQGCLPASLYSPESYQTPNGGALPIIAAAQLTGLSNGTLIKGIDPYASQTQSMNLRVIQSALKPFYKAKNDIVEFTADYDFTPTLKLTWQTGYNHDFLASSEDFNRFNSNPGLFFSSATEPNAGIGYGNGSFGVNYTPGGILCDPQLGCSDRFVGEDLSQERAWQISQEVRLTSSFSGPLNFSFGGNYLHYETLEDYYVFLNVLTTLSRVLDQLPQVPGNNVANGVCNNTPQAQVIMPFGTGHGLLNCPYTDGTPLTPGFDGQGHNYFRSTNPYVLTSYAGFGEAYYQILKDVKLTGGLRWTDDQKHFVEVPSEVLNPGWGYPASGIVDQEWREFTGRGVINWTPKLSFTDQTLIYASFSRGYKAGGANPPPPNPLLGVTIGVITPTSVTHPLTFAPEFVNAYELGTKDTLLDGALTVNADLFYYDYKGYQISQIVDRTSVNLNFNANIRGAEVETTWEPVPGLRFNFAGGWEDTKLASGSQAIDLMDRTAGHSDWLVVKPSVFTSSNCILPQYLVAELLAAGIADPPAYTGGTYVPNPAWFITSVGQATTCEYAYNVHKDPILQANNQIKANGYTGSLPLSGFDPTTAPNNGEGFDKDLSGNQLPNAPPLTASFGAQYSMPLTPDWAGTIRADYYWQDYSWARVFNDNPYDRLRGYTNVNLTFILTNQNGWQAMAYAKNLFNTTAITGAFLNSDDTALTTNVFVTDPRLIGIRVTKNW